MIVALLNQKGDIGKTTIALHLAGHWARHGKGIGLIDADRRAPHSTGPNSARRRLDRLCGLIGLARAAS